MGSTFLSSGAHADGSIVTFGVEVPTVPVLEIVLYDGATTAGDVIESGDSKTMTVVPKMATAGFNSSAITVSVGTSNASGYNLRMYADNTSLVSTTNIDDTIETLGSGNFTCTSDTAENCNFTVNHWGYKKSTDTNYLSVPAQANAAELNSNNAPTNAETTTVDFGSRINAEQPAGLYTATINFVALANPAVAEMQNLAPTTCTTTPTVVTDTRDNQPYTIQRLEDGNCWMIENLNLGDTDNYPLVAANLDSTNTNLASGASDIPAATFTSWKKTSGTQTRTRAEFIPIHASNAADGRETDSVSDSPYGTLYNYCATSAGTMCADRYSTATNAQSSLCPAGWRLPTGGPSSDFTALSVAYGGLETTMDSSTIPTGATMQNILRNQLKMTFAGSFDYSTPVRQGTYGNHWSSTWLSATDMYRLLFDATSVYPTNGSNRLYGLSIRCLLESYSTIILDSAIGETDTVKLQNTLATLPGDTFTRSGYVLTGWNTRADGTGTSYAIGATVTSALNNLTLYAQWEEVPAIQDLTLSQCQVNVGTNGNPANVGDNITVYDRRDGSDYTVRYINGACWMTQNLRFLGNTGSASGKMTLTSDTSNGANTTVDLYSLNSSNAGNFGAYSSHCDSTNGYNYACVYDSGSTTTGVWYNYYATTAGNINTNSNGTAVSANGPSICPAGWHLPTGAAADSSSEFYKLFQSTTSGSWIATNNYLTAFGAVPGGRYDNGSLNGETRGGWWSATAYSSANRYYLRYDSSNIQFNSGNNYRYYGFFVRCVRTS